MIYGKMNIPEMYFFHAMLVLVTRNAVVPPKIMANTQVQKARSIPERYPEICLGKSGGEKVNVVDQCIARVLL